MKVFVASNPTDAHILCELLKQASIACDVRGEALFGLRGELPLNEDTAPYIWLYDPQQLTAARAIIDDYLQPVNEQHRADWRCRQCGELNEAQFGACWRCGTPDIR